MPDLWAYATGKWMTVREPSSDKNRARWPIKAFWEDVQSAGDCFGMQTDITRIAEKRPNYQALRQQLRGIMKTMGAIDTVVMENEKLALTHLDLVWEAIKRDPGFLKEMKQRAAKLSSMNPPRLKRF